jgi:transcriptional regulator with XRE-family HTH domain
MKRQKVRQRDWLRIYRTHLEYSLRELSAQVGISFSALAQYEKGNMTPSAETAKKIGEVLGFDESMFFERI